VELKAYAKNVDWVARRILRWLIVSMHRTGLWQNRYNVFTEPSMRTRERSQAVQNAKREVWSETGRNKKRLGAGNSDFGNELAYNYMALQVFDLLSLYFCCDGYAAEDQFKPYTIAPVRVSYDEDETVRLTIRPNGPGSVIFSPYPFDLNPLEVSARARLLAAAKEKTEAACIDAYHKASRRLLTFQLSA
jgi:hypothetical protein